MLLDELVGDFGCILAGHAAHPVASGRVFVWQKWGGGVPPPFLFTSPNAGRSATPHSLRRSRVGGRCFRFFFSRGAAEPSQTIPSPPLGERVRVRGSSEIRRRKSEARNTLYSRPVLISDS